MEYRWYTTQDGGRPENGFFVNPENQILYWPNKQTPGYVLDPHIAETIRDISSNNRDIKNVLALGLALVVIIVRILYKDPALHEQYKLLTGNFSFTAASLLAILIGTIFIGLSVQLHRRRKIGTLLMKCEKLDASRPRVQFLKPSETKKKTNAPSRIRKGLTSPILFLMAAFGLVKGFSSPLLGDKVCTLIVATIVIWGWMIIKKKEQTGLRRDQVDSLTD